MPNGIIDPYDPNIDYQAIFEAKGGEVLEPELILGDPLANEEELEIPNILTSGISEGIQEAKDLIDNVTGGLTKVYTQIYYLAGFGLVAWIYSSYKKWENQIKL